MRSLIDLPLELPKQRKIVVAMSIVDQSVIRDILNKHSKLDKIS